MFFLILTVPLSTISFWSIREEVHVLLVIVIFAAFYT